MSNNNERQIQQIIRELQRLQLRQTALVDQLHQLTQTRNTRAPAGPATRVNTGPATRAPRTAPSARASAVRDTETATEEVFDVGDRVTIRNPRAGQNPQGVIVREASWPQPTAPRDFDIGYRVRIANPGPGQNPIGVIVRVGPSQVIIEARDGTQTRGAPKNLFLLNRTERE